MNTIDLEVGNRIGRLWDILLVLDLGALFIIQNADLFYFTGTLQQGALFLHREAEPILIIYFNSRTQIVLYYGFCILLPC